jgi:predicted alpha/beta-hydrolase family hydrolase
VSYEARLSVYRTETPVAGLVLAHGAGAGQKSAFMLAAARGLAARGIVTATFDFPYIAMGRKVPDKGPVLEAAWREAIERARADDGFRARPLFIGGKSMGGRIASQVAAGIAPPVAGLVFLGYPLHPPGKPAQRRDAHLPAIAQPMLFVQGSADAFGSAEEIRALLPRLSRGSVLHEIASGDHSFKVTARTGRTPSDVMTDVLDAVASFVRALV